MKVQIILPEAFIENNNSIFVNSENLDVIKLIGLERSSFEDKTLFVLDYHTITVQLTEFQPDIIIYIPFVYSEIDMQKFEFTKEFIPPLTTEFLTHLCEINQIIKSKIILLQNTNYQFKNEISNALEECQAIIQNYPLGSIKSVENFDSNITDLILGL